MSTPVDAVAGPNALRTWADWALRKRGITRNVRDEFHVLADNWEADLVELAEAKQRAAQLSRSESV